MWEKRYDQEEDGRYDQEDGRCDHTREKVRPTIAEEEEGATYPYKGRHDRARTVEEEGAIRVAMTEGA